MLYNISWATFGSFTVLLVIFYYGWVAACFYRKDIIRLFSGNGIPGDNEPEAPSLAQQSFTAEIRAFSLQAAQGNYSKQELLQSMKLLIKKFGGVHHLIDKNVISSIIGRELERRCSIHLDKAELDGLWESRVVEPSFL